MIDSICNYIDSLLHRFELWIEKQGERCPIEYYWNLFSIIILTFTPNNSKHPASDYVKADSKKDKSNHSYKFSRMITTKKFQIICPKA